MKRKILQRSVCLNQRFIVGDFPRGTINYLGSGVNHNDIGVFSSHYHDLKEITREHYIFVEKIHQGHRILGIIDGKPYDFQLNNGLGLKLLAMENIGVVWAFLVILGHDNIKNFETALNNYSLVDHRLTLVQTKDNIHYFNGSKCTNSFAFKALINYVQYNYTGKNYWILGGILNSPLDFFYDSSLVNDSFYVFGKDKEILGSFLKNHYSTVKIFNNLEEIMESIPMDLKSEPLLPINVLLTPGCQSLDQFKDFEHRGKVFVDLCLKI